MRLDFQKKKVRSSVFDFSLKYLISVGNEVMDSDHKMLLTLCQKIHDSTRPDRKIDDLERALDELLQYTREHFDREEAEMRRINYANLIPHTEDHDKQIQNVFKLRNLFGDANPLLTVQVSRYLGKALLQHIAAHDKQLGAAIQVAAGGQ
jgi:hemerythrin-like metal-binding protein